MTRSLMSFFCCAVVACSAMTFKPAATAWCAGPEWVFLDEDLDSRFYYDKGGTKKTAEGIVRVRTRVVYTEKGKSEALKILHDSGKFGNLFESRYLHDLDCKKEQSRLLEATHLDKEGAILKSTDLATGTEWEEIPPYSRIGLVLEKTCPPAPAAK